MRHSCLFVFLLIAFRQFGSAQTEQGYLDIKSTPEGASIYIDGQPMGGSPAFLTLTVGRHTLEVSYKDYVTEKVVVEIRVKEITKQVITLREGRGFKVKPTESKVIAQAKGKLSVISTPSSGRVYIDRVEVTGDKTPLTIEELGAGEHEVTVECYMGPPLNKNLEATRSVTISPYETTLLRIDFMEYLKEGSIELKSNISDIPVTAHNKTLGVDVSLITNSTSSVVVGDYELTGTQSNSNLSFEVRKGRKTLLYVSAKEKSKPLLALADHPDYLDKEAFMKKMGFIALPESEYVSSTHRSIGWAGLIFGGLLTTIGVEILTHGPLTAGETLGGVAFLGLGGYGIVGSIVQKGDVIIEAKSIEANIARNTSTQEQLNQKYDDQLNKWAREISAQNDAIRKQNLDIEARNKNLPGPTVDYK